MKNYLCGYTVLLYALCCSLTSAQSSYYEQGRVCLEEQDDPCFRYGNADFGYVEETTTKGLIVPAVPVNACMPIEPMSKYKSHCKPACFVLVKEGTCGFGYKVLMARQAGYQFVIIYNPNSNDLKEMGAGKYGKDVGKIMPIFVGKNAGQLLLKYNYTTGTKVSITPSNLFPDLEIYLIPFVIIVGICFILMAMFMVSRYYRNYLEKRRNRITPANLKKIPTKKFKKGDEYYDVCAICLDEYKDGDKLRILPCDHVYHCKCVDPWLTEGKKTCPVCKRPVESKRTRNNRRSEVERGQGNRSDPDVDETTPLIQSSQTQLPDRSIEV